MFRVDIPSEGWVGSREGAMRTLRVLAVLLVQLLVYVYLAWRGVTSWPLFVLLALQVGVVVQVKSQHYFISSDGECLRYKLSYGVRRRRVVPWSSIQSVRVGPAYIRFQLVHRGRRQLSLGWLSYGLLRAIKAAVIQESRRLGKPVTVVKIQA